MAGNVVIRDAVKEFLQAGDVLPQEVDILIDAVRNIDGERGIALSVGHVDEQVAHNEVAVSPDAVGGAHVGHRGVGAVVADSIGSNAVAGDVHQVGGIHGVVGAVLGDNNVVDVADALRAHDHAGEDAVVFPVLVNQNSVAVLVGIVELH